MALKRLRLYIILLAGAGLAAGCTERTIEPEISLADAAKSYISESETGMSIYGGDLVATVELRDRFPGISSDSVTWSAVWTFRPPKFTSEVFDTGTFRGVPGMRMGKLWFTDQVDIALTFRPDQGPIVEKTNLSSAQSRAEVVQLGTYGDPYHGWFFSKIAHRKFSGKVTGSPNLAIVTVEHPDGISTLATTPFSVDNVLYLARGDSVTVSVTTGSTQDRLFLNVGDSGSRVRRPMPFNSQQYQFVGGWRVSSQAPSSDYFQAFIEAYALSSFTSTDSAAVSASGHSIVYRIK